MCNGCGEGAESVRARRGRGNDARGCVEAPKASRSVIPPCNTCAGTKSPSSSPGIPLTWLEPYLALFLFLTLPRPRPRPRPRPLSWPLMLALSLALPLT